MVQRSCRHLWSQFDDYIGSFSGSINRLKLDVLLICPYLDLTRFRVRSLFVWLHAFWSFFRNQNRSSSHSTTLSSSMDSEAIHFFIVPRNERLYRAFPLFFSLGRICVTCQIESRCSRRNKCIARFSTGPWLAMALPFLDDVVHWVILCLANPSYSLFALFHCFRLARYMFDCPKCPSSRLRNEKEALFNDES